MFFAMLLLSRSRGGQPRHVRPARAPRDRALPLRLPRAPSALQGCFLNLPTEAFDEAFSSSGLLTTEPCATVTTNRMPCPTPRPAVRRRRWGSTRPRTSSTSRRQRCAYLPPDLCPSASLTGAMPRSGAVLVGRTLTWSSAGSTARVYLAKYVTKRDEEPDEEDGPMPCLA